MRSCDGRLWREGQEGPDCSAVFVAVDAPAGGQLIDQVEAAAVQLVLFGLLEVWAGGAAFVQNGEDQQVAARVDGHSEAAARPAAARVPYGISSQFRNDEFGDVGFGAVGQVVRDESARLTNLRADPREVPAPRVNLFVVVWCSIHAGPPSRLCRSKPCQLLSVLKVLVLYFKYKRLDVLAPHNKYWSGKQAAIQVAAAPRRVHMFGLMVRFTCKDETSAAAFDQLVSETIEAIRQHEPATIVYASHRVDGEPLQRIFYELYRDRAAFDAHEQTEHTKRFLAAREHLLNSVEVDWLELQSGKGTAS